MDLNRENFTEIKNRFTSQTQGFDWAGYFNSCESLEDLKWHQQRFSFLAQDFDPFSNNLSPESQNIIEFYELDPPLNPFDWTNFMLKRLDEIDRAIRKKSQ